MSPAAEPFTGRPAAVPQAPHPLWGTLRTALPPRSFYLTVLAVWAGVALLVLGLLYWKGRLERLPEIAAGIALLGTSILLFIGWILFAGRVIQLNTPEAARLVPAQPSALRRVLVLGAAVVCMLSLVCAWGLARLFDGTPLPHAWVASVSLAALALSLWGSRQPVFWIVIWPLFSLGFGSSAMKRLWFQGAEFAAGPMGLPMVVGCAVALAVVIHVAILEGGERHRTQQLRMKRWESASRGTPQINAGREDAQGGWFGPAMWAAPAARLYDRWFDRLVAAPAARRGGARAMLCFGPSLHPVSAIGQVLWLMLGVLIFMAGRWAWRQFSSAPQTAESLLAGLTVGLGVGGAFAVMGLGIYVRQILWRTRTEQALMTLVPGVPQGPALSRRLALHMGAVVLVWVAVLAIPTGLLWLTEDPDRLGKVSSKLSFSLLLWLPMLWIFVSDWSRLQDPSRRIWPLVAAAIVLFVLGMVGGAAGAGWRDGLNLAGLALGLGGLAWRWWRMGREPAALPVGRRA